MLLPFFLSLRLRLQSDVVDSMFEKSKSIPGCLYTSRSAKWVGLKPSWTSLTARDASDPEILRVDADCDAEPDACGMTVVVRTFPTLFVIFAGVSTPVFINHINEVKERGQLRDSTGFPSISSSRGDCIELTPRMTWRL
jgi:hypothetical protein